MDTILVTGGAGFIGSHCIDFLLKRGDKVVCVDNFNDFYSPRIKQRNIRQFHKSSNFAFYRCDIAHPAMSGIIKDVMPDKILHLAARAGVQPSLDNPEEYVRSNVDGTARIFEAARELCIDKIVFASSSSVYGGNKKVPFSEDDRVDTPFSPYAATKRMCEILASNYHHITGMHIAALRYFTVYGPRNRPDMMAYKFVDDILAERQIKVYWAGDEIKRDWTYVDDIVKGTIAALDNVEKFGFEIFNLGNSRPVPVAYFVELLEKELGKKANIVRAPLPVGDVPITYADVGKAKRLLNWEPATPIEEGVKNLVEWYRQKPY